MIYACDDCGFLFRRFGKVTVCPACQSGRVRPGTETESRQLQGVLISYGQEQMENKEEKHT